MCDPGDDPTVIEEEAKLMGERDGIRDRRATEPSGIDFGRWLSDTLRLWPILLVIFGVGWRAEDTRGDVDAIQEDFVKYGPRVSTEGDRPTTIESELRDFKGSLGDDFMTREVLELKLDIILDDVAETRADVAETKAMVEKIQESNK